jgi:hypothetical protein
MSAAGGPGASLLFAVAPGERGEAPIPVEDLDELGWVVERMAEACARNQSPSQVREATRGTGRSGRPMSPASWPR